MDSIKTRQCMESVWRIEADAIASLTDTMDMDVLLHIAELLCNCKGKIVISGCGTSGVAARKAAHMLNCVQAPCTFLSPSDALHGGLGMLRPEDILILLSKGGQSFEINAFIPPCKRAGTTLIAVTESNDSELAKAADHKIIVVTEVETGPLLLATSSIVKVIAIFDAIVQSIALHKNYGSGEFVHIHPGGAVGKILVEETRPGGD